MERAVDEQSNARSRSTARCAGPGCEAGENRADDERGGLGERQDNACGEEWSSTSASAGSESLDVAISILVKV